MNKCFVWAAVRNFSMSAKSVFYRPSGAFVPEWDVTINTCEGFK